MWGRRSIHLESAAEKDHPYAAYLAGKIRLSEEGYLDVEKAVRLFEAAAALGNDFAEYQLGKLYLYGKDVSQNMEAAVRWLTALGRTRETSTPPSFSTAFETTRTCQ